MSMPHPFFPNGWDPSDVDGNNQAIQYGSGRRQGQANKRSAAQYQRHFRSFLRQQYKNCFRYEGIGPHVEGRFVEDTMLDKQVGVFYVQAAGEMPDNQSSSPIQEARLTFREAAPGGYLNDQWITTEYRTIQPGGGSRLIRTAGDLSDWGGVPLYDNLEHDDYGRKTIMLYAKRLAEAAITVDVNLENTRTQRVALIDEDEKKTAAMLADFGYNGNGMAFVRRQSGDRPLSERMELIDYATHPDYPEKNHAVFHSLMGEALNALGIQAQDNTKKAQQSVDEISSADAMVKGIRLGRLDSRRWTVDKLNQRYPGMQIRVIDTGTGESN